MVFGKASLCFQLTVATKPDGEHEESGSQKWFLHGIFA